MNLIKIVIPLMIMTLAFAVLAPASAETCGICKDTYLQCASKGTNLKACEEKMRSCQSTCFGSDSPPDASSSWTSGLWLFIFFLVALYFSPIFSRRRHSLPSEEQSTYQLPIMSEIAEAALLKSAIADGSGDLFLEKIVLETIKELEVLAKNATDSNTFFEKLSMLTGIENKNLPIFFSNTLKCLSFPPNQSIDALNQFYYFGLFLLFSSETSPSGNVNEVLNYRFQKANKIEQTKGKIIELSKTRELVRNMVVQPDLEKASKYLLIAMDYAENFLRAQLAQTSRVNIKKISKENIHNPSSPVISELVFKLHNPDSKVHKYIESMPDRFKTLSHLCSMMKEANKIEDAKKAAKKLAKLNNHAPTEIT